MRVCLEAPLEMLLENKERRVGIQTNIWWAFEWNSSGSTIISFFIIK
jgi:hypothetical protein